MWIPFDSQSNMAMDTIVLLGKVVSAGSISSTSRRTKVQMVCISCVKHVKPITGIYTYLSCFVVSNM